MALNKIEELFFAVEQKYRGQENLTKLASDSIRCQVFGVFAVQYKRWQQLYMHSPTQPTDFTKCFADSEILQGKNMIVFRALLFFNLPDELIFRERVRPVKGYSYPPEVNQKKAELRDLLEDAELDESEEAKSGTTNWRQNQGGKRQSIILMEVEVDTRDKPTNVIGGFASHQWRPQALNTTTFGGDDTCFLFNLTQNLRFNARKKEVAGTIF